MSTAIIETEETLVIETPERVPLAFALASIGNRFLAAAIDHFIQYFAIFVVGWTFLSIAGYGSFSQEASALSEMEPKHSWVRGTTIVQSRVARRL